MSKQISLSWVLGAALLLVSLAMPASAGTVYVSATGNNANDGLSWATAKQTVQAGLNATTASDQVWVAAGTYVENIILKEGVALYGGFAGTEDPATFDLADRDWVTNETVLDGNQAGSVVTSPSGATATTRIDGFTIRNGFGTLLGDYFYGGGIYGSSSTPTIANNTITGNIADKGGGIYCDSAPMIVDNTIAGNGASSGGGIYCASSTATIADNTIAGNSASSGGGIYCESSSPTIAGNTIAGNGASSYGSGGGIYCRSSSPAITNNTIAGNGADFGGGVYCDDQSSPTITDNTIARNVANSGGGVYCQYASPTIADNTIAGNRASYAGGIYCYGGSPTIVNNTIARNAASYVGGGIYCDYQSTPTVANNTITGNSASTGGGISCDSASPTIVNTIVAFNSSGIATTGTGTLNLRHNCVYGNTAYNYSGVTDPTGSNGNISTDPKLADIAYGNMHIQPDSPCFDAGDDAAIQPGWVDIDGQSRTNGIHVDIGSDESDGTWPVPGPYEIIRVSPEGDDANDGSSWVWAKKTVQAGIDAAAGLGGEVWVKAGMYRERITLAPFAHVYGGFGGMETVRETRDEGAHATTLDGQSDGSVVTAWAGVQVSTIDGFTIRNGRATSGGGIRCHFASPNITNNTIAGNSAEFGGGIHCVGHSSPTITNNTIAGNGANIGGGIFCDSASPAIVNTIVAFNSSGIVKTGTGTPSLRHNCVYGNTAYNYSGVTDPTGTDGNISADPKLADVAYGNTHIQPDSPCLDAGDDAVVQPDWVDIDGQSRTIGTHVDIGSDESDGTWPVLGPYAIVRVSPEGDDGNDGSSWASAKWTVQAGIDAAAGLGGEVWVKTGTYLERITLAPFAHVYGGFGGMETVREERATGVYATILDGQAAGSVVTAWTGDRVSTIDGFTIRNGRATHGGGIYCYVSSPTIANNTIARNGAFSDGGGVYCRYSSPTIANNAIMGNGASNFGGGIYCHVSSPSIAGNTIAGNGASNDGGGIYCDSSSSTVANTIVAFNSSGIALAGTGTLMLRYNCVYGNTAYNYFGVTEPTGSDGNISADPLLVRMPEAGADGQWGTADDDIGIPRLQAGSPGIDAGDNEAVPADTTDLDGDGDTGEPMPMDLAGKARFVDDPDTVDTGNGVPPIVDLGAYEYFSTIRPDLDCDGDVDPDDWTIFQACTTGPTISYGPQSLPPGCNLAPDGDGYIAADLDSDHDVDQSDFGIFQRCFSGQGHPVDPACMN